MLSEQQKTWTKKLVNQILENNNKAQCVSTIASVCSPKIGNDRLITMGAITYSREFIG